MYLPFIFFLYHGTKFEIKFWFELCSLIGLAVAIFSSFEASATNPTPLVAEFKSFSVYVQFYFVTLKFFKCSTNVWSGHIEEKQRERKFDGALDAAVIVFWRPIPFHWTREGISSLKSLSLSPFLHKCALR